MNEGDYRRVTYDFTLAAAQTLARLNPNMTFIYVSGAGTDSTGQGSTMWARVKGQTENALFQLPFKAAYAFRPAYIQPLNGIVPKTAWLRALYAVASAPVPGVEGALSQVRDHDGADGPRNDPRRQGRRTEARAGKSGHQRDLRRRKLTAGTLC